MQKKIEELEETLYEMEMDGDDNNPRYFYLCDELDRLYEKGAEVYV